MNTTTAKLQSYLKLEMPRFRHAVLVAACISVVVVLVLSPVVNEAAKSVGLTASLGALVFLVSVLLDHVASLKAHPPDLEVHRTYVEANIAQQEFLHEQHPAHVKLCESTAGSALQIFDQLKGLDDLREVQMLVCHPDQLSGTECRHLQVNLEKLAKKLPLEIAESKGLRVKCYSHPASLRGRNFGGRLVVAGWYTYERGDRDDAATRTGSSYVITGEQAPVVVARAGQPAGTALLNAFDSAFKRLWEDALPLKEALGSFPSAPSLTDDWVAQVSR